MPFKGFDCADDEFKPCLGFRLVVTFVPQMKTARPVEGQEDNDTEPRALNRLVMLPSAFYDEVD